MFFNLTAGRSYLQLLICFKTPSQRIHFAYNLKIPVNFVPKESAKNYDDLPKT
ncbi:MAG: hypothetical protein LBP59_08815 [Planctomycetaceae bacterium]|nr:hypothetical protein [Planctomycetaceae bacterium]